MTNEQMAALESRITKIESILEIQKLQAKYGYYLQRGGTSNWDELMDLYTDDCEVELMDSGVHIGRKGLTKLIKDPKKTLHSAGLMGIIMQIQPYIEVYGDIARGVWQGFGFIVHEHGANGEKMPLWHLGRYENEYKKVDGTWKISKSHLKIIFQTPFNAENGWVSHPLVGSIQPQLTELGIFMPEFYDRPPTEFRPYNPLAKIPDEAMPDPILPPTNKK